MEFHPDVVERTAHDAGKQIGLASECAGGDPGESVAVGIKSGDGGCESVEHVGGVVVQCIELGETRVVVVGVGMVVRFAATDLPRGADFLQSTIELEKLLVVDTEAFGPVADYLGQLLGVELSPVGRELPQVTGGDVVDEALLSITAGALLVVCL